MYDTYCACDCAAGGFQCGLGLAGTGSLGAPASERVNTFASRQSAIAVELNGMAKLIHSYLARSFWIVIRILGSTLGMSGRRAAGRAAGRTPPRTPPL